VVLSPEEVSRLIVATGNLKHQTALSLAYGTGLRASEVVVLKADDIDRQQGPLRHALADTARAPARLVARLKKFCRGTV
jgi:integrase